MFNFPLAASMAFSFLAASRAVSVAEAGVSHLLFRLQKPPKNQNITYLKYSPIFSSNCVTIFSVEDVVNR